MVDVARVVDERLNRHLSAILEAVHMVRNECTSHPLVEQALQVGPGRVRAALDGQPQFPRNNADLVCGAVLRVDSPASLEVLTRRLRVATQPGLRFLIEAVGRVPNRTFAYPPSRHYPGRRTLGGAGRRAARLVWQWRWRRSTGESQRARHTQPNVGKCQRRVPPPPLGTRNSTTFCCT